MNPKTRDDFFSIQIPTRALTAMRQTLSQVGVLGLESWYDSLDPEFVRDLCAAYQLWLKRQVKCRIAGKSSKCRRA